MPPEPSVSRLMGSVLRGVPGCLPATHWCLLGSKAAKQSPCRCRPGEHRVLPELPAECACFVVTQTDDRCAVLGVLAFRVTPDSGPPPKSTSAQQAEQLLVGAVVVQSGCEAAARVVGRDDVDGLLVTDRKRADRHPARSRSHSDRSFGQFDIHYGLLVERPLQRSGDRCVSGHGGLRPRGTPLPAGQGDPRLPPRTVGAWSSLEGTLRGGRGCQPTLVQGRDRLRDRDGCWHRNRLEVQQGKALPHLVRSANLPAVMSSSEKPRLAGQRPARSGCSG